MRNPWSETLATPKQSKLFKVTKRICLNALFERLLLIGILLGKHGLWDQRFVLRKLSKAFAPFLDSQREVKCCQKCIKQIPFLACIVSLPTLKAGISILRISNQNKNHELRVLLCVSLGAMCDSLFHNALFTN